VIASAGRDEMVGVRNSLQYYGPTVHHWAPYRPELDEPLGTYASAIAGRQRFGAELAGLDGLPDRMDRAKGRNEIVVLLVDPWIARIASYGASLIAYDQLNKPSSPVLVVVSDRDEETVRHRDELAESLAATLPNNWIREDSIFREEVKDAEQFARDLQATLDEALNRLLKRGTVFRRPPMEASVPRPVLEGPTG
jgi:FxsC-like protein